ncbi:DUF2255 family protein [Gordonia insulae]|uniref:DUF2255 domain-containing protein n=1 Tax=Gordonia insulae TaxID=2420509 RepID=A0A3G8JHR6_9ACTN|nr:DUF2255 family protein [Gordonia insulae]AZG44543.1 hypothetical protein D7316_01129 [Gordonia insulae]
MNTSRVWTQHELDQIGATSELQISAPKAGGSWRRPVPIWVVCVDGCVYVRTWYRRDNGWFGDAVRSQHARVSVPGLSTDVAVTDLGDSDSRLRIAVDDAYRAKYAEHGSGSVGGMVTDDAAASTLQLTPWAGS